MPNTKASPPRHTRARKKRRQREPNISPAGPSSTTVAQPSTRLLAALCLALCLLTAVVYWQTSHFGFVSYDDDQYVYKNPHVQEGLTASSVGWAWTTFFYTYWHPLTWMSLMLDRQLFGNNAGAFHLTNVALHMAGAVLLLLALARMTRCPWRSAVVAGIFALHPMHVESVAWVTERKDVLSVALGMLALWLYARYAERPSARRYLWAALAFGLSLTAKPMLVTFPMVLLLLDFWPLRRIAWPLSWPSLKQPVLEKVPFLVMAGISIVLTFMAQHAHPVVSNLTSFTSFTLPARLANACISYALYLWKAFFPFGLGVLYPPVPPDPGAALLAALFLLAITAAAFGTIRQRPYLAVGWLWYLGTMVPVSGLVMQSNADRFTYFPLVGFSIALVWVIAGVAASRPILRQGAGILAGAMLLLLAAGAHAQAAYWRDSLTLFQHTVEVTKRNYIVLNNLGVTLAAEGRHNEAMADYRQALSIHPGYGDARANLGHELLRAGKLEEAHGALVEALRVDPDLAIAQGDLGIVLVANGKIEEARQHLQESLRLAPDNADLQSDLCLVLQRLGRLDEALSHCAEAVRLQPDLVDGHFNRGTALAAQGKNAAAEAEFLRVLAANPNYAEARVALESLRAPAEARH